MVTLFQYPACSTCRKAVKWLDEHDIAHRSVHIVEAPPSAAQLARLLERGIALRSLFNTSGESYRLGGFKDKLPTMSETEALAALASDGKLIKRPLLVSEDVVLVGFREEEWSRALVKR